MKISRNSGMLSVLAVTLIFGIFSCGDIVDIIDYRAPVIEETTKVTTPTNDSTPNYTFTSTEAGTITYGGSCSSGTTSAFPGYITITFNSLNEGTYSDCTIKVTDFSGNVSNTLRITSFTVDLGAGTLVEVTAVTNPTNDNTPDYTFSSSEAGRITYGGSCSSSTTSATIGNNTITLVTLSDGTYSNCTITVTDSLGNSVTLNMSSFVVDTTAPVIAEVTAVTNPTNDLTPNYTFSATEAGTITYGGSCASSTTSATTNNNTITLVALSDGTYSDCTIIVIDALGNASNTLSITSFTVEPIEFVAVGESGTILISTDNGSTFDNKTSPTVNGLREVAYGNNIFVAVGLVGTILRSQDDGQTWDNVTSPTTENLYGIAYGNKTFVAVGASGTILRSQDIGTTWDIVTSPISNILFEVTYGNNTFVAGGNNGKILRSSDNGSTFLKVSSPISSKTIFGVTFGNNTFVAVAKSGKIIMSSDNGSSFSKMTSPVDKTNRGVAFGNNTFVIVGEGGTIVISSDNGSNWTDATYPINDFFYGITYVNNAFILVGESGIIKRSTNNGSSWDNVTSATTSLLHGVVPRE